MAQKPIIGVTGPDRGGLTAWLMTALAIRRGGGTPVRITAGRATGNRLPERSQLKALVIGGGTDVDPFHYNQEPEPAEDAAVARQRTVLDWLVGLVLGLFRIAFATRSTQAYDPERDKLEKDLIQYAMDRQLPVLGICRGAQLMNVALGGSLHQDIGHFYTEETSNVRSILPRKTISVETDSRLYEILGSHSCFVNALHNQSINRLGKAVTVSAVEPNGVVQAIEQRNEVFFLGVQWHPEYMPQSTTQQALFRGLVRCAREH